jgi:hypothetical protein
MLKGRNDSTSHKEYLFANFHAWPRYGLILLVAAEGGTERKAIFKLQITVSRYAGIWIYSQ